MQDSEGLIVKQQTSEPDFPAVNPQPGLKVVGSRRRGDADSGIEVREEELCLVRAQRMYKMRCECGRSWFELESPKFVHCPACHKLGIVSS